MMGLYSSVKTSIPVTITDDQVGKLQYLKIEREFWQDPEREQHRKSYVEESYWENYFIAIRCDTSAGAGVTCATLAKEPETNEHLQDVSSDYDSDPGFYNKGWHMFDRTQSWKRAVRPLLMEDR